jgi:NADH:ubiquinone oxidoreductase subunit 3 (subunit A)
LYEKTCINHEIFFYTFIEDDFFLKRLDKGSHAGCYYLFSYLKDQFMGPAALVLLLLCGIAFAGGGIILSRLLAKRSPNPAKGEPYECGIPTSGTSWIQFNVGYYLFALIFLVFDVELIFMYPWAVVVKQIGIPALIEIVIFMFILFMGLLYAWKKGALKWM